MAELNLHLQFPTEQIKEDFKTAFQGWLKQYQQQATVSAALSGGAGQQGGQAAGLQGGQAESYGFPSGGSQAGLFGWGGGQVGPVTSGGVYLNFIPGW
ncbi:MAG: hypothetical protein OEU26_22650 [Candidatus Tectomicrobia bacterium]|nr:hypothetical protein [Candidatus Tectomicrobia bacterium]